MIITVTRNLLHRKTTAADPPFLCSAARHTPAPPRRDPAALCQESVVGYPAKRTKRQSLTGSPFCWWERVDSNHRSRRQQIYSLPPLATRERSHIRLSLLKEGGAGRRTRTPDLLITNQLLYQLSYTSTISSEVYVTRNVPICQPLNLFFWRFFILRIVRKRWRDLQRAWPAGLCPRCGMELYPGDLDWVLGGRRLCGACAAAWLAEEAERLAAGRKGAVE